MMAAVTALFAGDGYHGISMRTLATATSRSLVPIHCLAVVHSIGIAPFWIAWPSANTCSSLMPLSLGPCLTLNCAVFGYSGGCNKTTRWRRLRLRFRCRSLRWRSICGNERRLLARSRRLFPIFASSSTALRGSSPAMLSVARTSYGELVCSLGGYGEQVRQLDQLAPTLCRVFASGLLAIINVINAPSQPSSIVEYLRGEAQ